MISQLKRKIRRVLSDPVLQRWLLARLLGQTQSLPAFSAHQPPYAQDLLPLVKEDPTWHRQPIQLKSSQPFSTIELYTPGKSISVQPGAADKFFSTNVDDIEVDLARHRFAWLQLADKIDPDWLQAIWSVWRRQYMDVDGWHWHPYTVTERAINILDGLERCGSPMDLGEIAQDLASHAPEIASRLEYFGDHNTSNHLANNGRGLYRLGCALNLDQARILGFRILSNEAQRIFLPSGMLREGSTHYHMLYVRNYLDAWLAAKRHARTEDAEHLGQISKKLLGAAKRIVLSHGLPLIGDISPDCPPSFLKGLETGACAWTARLNANEQDLCLALAASTEFASINSLQQDGWARIDTYGWEMLATAPPTGWPFMPGHAHHDLGSSEIHYNGQPLFIDPGRGAYGEDGDAALYRSSAVHGTLRIDETDPYPPNKPYYDDAFRQKISAPLKSTYTKAGLTISHGGFQHIGVEQVSRSWQFDKSSFQIHDDISTNREHHIERSLVTSLHVSAINDDAFVDDRFSVKAAGANLTLRPVTIWSAYGEGTQGTQIVFKNTCNSSWSGTIDVKVLA
jgi:hypothetical protein